MAKKQPFGSTERKILVWSTYQFESFHKWKDAPYTTKYLRSLHRHIFHVKVSWIVSHNDREREFIAAKNFVHKRVQRTLAKTDTSEWSCERWAEHLLTICSAYEVTVSEDAENGSTVTRI